MTSQAQDLAAVAAQLRHLVQSSPRTEDSVETWSAYASEVHRELETKYPRLRLPVEIMHYVHDADIRVREPDYAASQNRAMESFIQHLEAGVVPGGEMASLNIDLPGGRFTLSASVALSIAAGSAVVGTLALLIVRGCG